MNLMKEYKENLSNDEIKKLCENMRKLHLDVDYGFEIFQTSKEVKIKWGYLNTIWTIDKYNSVYNEHSEFMNSELEDTTTLTGAIESSVYYMVTRY